MENITVLNEYPGSHHYFETFDRTDWFCPNCGLRGGVFEAEEGDYYAGGMSICTNCTHSGYLAGGMNQIIDAAALGMAQQLKAGIANQPTTKRGK